MATWIEIRCEKRSSGEGWRNRCWSDDNSGPMEMAADSQKSVVEVLKRLHTEAAKSGWVKTHEGWVCPCCTNTESLKGNPNET